MAGYFGLNLEQLASRDYTHTQQVSAQVHAMLGDDGQPLFDGVLYPSRNNYPAKSIALFERAAARVGVVDDIDLVDHVDWPRFVATYRVGVEPDPGRWNRMTKRPEAAREHIEAPNRMKWTKLE